jgi:hypothetical protein
LQQAKRELLIYRVVLGQKDAKRVAGGKLGIDAGLGWRGNVSARALVRQQRYQRVEELALPQRLCQSGGKKTIARLLAAAGRAE